MILRNSPIHWIIGVLTIIIIIYFKLQLTILENENKLLVDTIIQIQNQIKNDKIKYNKDLLLSSSSNLDDTIVIYNRVPKTGSTSFVGVVYDTCKKNKFHTLHVNITNNMHTLTLPNQLKFVNNVTKWNSMKPAFYHGHFRFLNFNKFGVKQTPLYINILRDPIDRYVSYYYFLRYGDNFRPYLIRKKAGDKKTFDDCVKAGQPDCDPSNMWLQIPFLCGHDPKCWEVGNKWALNEAKKNLEKYYLLVGVTEEIDDFIAILQTVLPRFFKGTHDYFLHSNKSHLRQTTQKLIPSEETILKLRNSTVWKMENELYEFALANFHVIKKKILNPSIQDLNQNFMYEKIRPK